MFFFCKDDVPSLFYHNESHIFGLTIIPKDESIELLDVPTRLQMESRYEKYARREGDNGLFISLVPNAL